MSQLLCVGLAPSLDRYARLDRLDLETINRPVDVVELAGGKALNVARSAAGLGLEVAALVAVGGHTGEAIKDLAGAEGIEVLAVDTGTPTRQCQVYLDARTGRITEIYEPLRPVWPACWPRLIDRYESALDDLADGGVVALSGRVPPGLPDAALHELTARAHRRPTVRVIVDSDGAPLAGVLGAAPHLVKVNTAEAARVLALADGSSLPPLDLARQLASLGPANVIVTNGAVGAVGVDRAGCAAEVRHEPIAAGTATGSGDAFLAGAAASMVARPGDVGREFAPGGILPGGTTPSATTPDRRCDGLHRMLVTGACAGRANTRNLLAGQISWQSVRAELPAVHLDTFGSRGSSSLRGSTSVDL